MTEQTATESKVSPKIGDILSSSWGYDQTNVDFYQVIGVTKSSVRIRKITQKVAHYGEGSDSVVPVKDAFVVAGPYVCSSDEPYVTEKGAVRKFVTHRDGYCCKVSDCARAYLWKGGAVHQTSANCGH
jgi:hypothetical protein